jgi:uncharacterized Zn-binding protein involved in type VI secretion
MPLASRLSDNHTCPMVTGTVPHVGGPISSPGVPSVLIEGKVAAVVGDTCTCVGPSDAISSGSSSVVIGGRAAARIGDPTVHGGVIVGSCSTVWIGG